MHRNSWIACLSLSLTLSVSAVHADTGEQCYGLQAVKDAPDLSQWLGQHQAETADLPGRQVVQVYNESIAQRYIRSGQRVLVFRPHAYKYYLYNHGRLIKSGVANGGKSWCSDIGRSCRTPAGVFKVYREGGSGCKSSKYPIGKGGAPMPYCMFLKKMYPYKKKIPYKVKYTTAAGKTKYKTKYRYETRYRYKHTGYAMHGSKYIHPSRHGSHGCIRLRTPDAQWLSHNHIDPGTLVVITKY